MGRSLTVAALVTLTGSLVACTALLGDFEVGASGPVNDGGGTSGEGGTSSGDAQTDAPADALVDAAPPPPVFKCVINGSPTTLEPAIPNASDRLALHSFRLGGNARRRVMYASPPATSVNFVTIDENLAAGSILKQGFDLVAPPMTLASFASGFVALGLGSKNGPQLYALRFDDAAVNAMDMVPISDATLPLAGAQDLSIAIGHVGADAFFVVVSFQTGANVWSMYAGAVRIAPGAPPSSFKLVDDKLVNRPSLDGDNLVIDRPDNRAILFMGADKGQGATTMVQMDLQSGAVVVPPKVVPAIHGTASFQPFATQTDIVADKTGVAFLEYDLNNAALPFYVYSFALPPAGFDKFQMTSLPPPVAFTSPSDIAVDKGRAFWTHFPNGGGSHVVEAARMTQSGKGVNFMWLDGAGHLRGKATSTDALAPSDAVKCAAGTMVDPPNQVIANAAVTWLTDSGSLKIANVGCAK